MTSSSVPHPSVSYSLPEVETLKGFPDPDVSLHLGDYHYVSINE